MDVASHRTRTRNISPIRYGTRMRQSGNIILKEGELFAQDIFSTSTVNPGGTVDVNLTVSNGAGSVPPGPDCCGPFCNQNLPGEWSSNGWEYRVTIELDGQTRETSTHCLRGSKLIGTRDNNHELSVPAPGQRGSYNLTITLELPGSETAGSTTRQVQVEQGGGERPGPDACEDNADCPENWMCENGSCVPGEGGGDQGGPILPCLLDPGRECALPDMITQGALILILIVLVLSR